MDGHSLRVLVTQSDPNERDTTRQVLEAGLGIEAGLRPQMVTVETCSDAYQALVELQGGASFDVLVVDLLMPGANAADLLERLNRYNIRVPSVIVTHVPASPVADRALSLGAYAVLAKPLRDSQLIGAVMKAAAIEPVIVLDLARLSEPLAAVS
jgi:CheY-like chemotaxis protein